MAELLLNVDDDLGGRYAISRTLRHAGYEVLEAATAAAALEIVRERRPALVLLDVNLPDMNGLDLCSQIKSDPSTADVLVLQHSASFVRPADQVRGLEKGADAYLTVPVEPEVLLATVRSLLRLRAAEQAIRKSANEWRATFDAISDAVAVLDADMHVRRCNRAFAALVGRDLHDVLGMRWTELLPGLGSLPFSRHRTSGDTAPRVEVELRHDNRWVRLVADPMWSARDELDGLVCVVSDIEGRKQIEEERRLLLDRERHARSQAEAAGRAKDEFLAVLSHELRTPLNAILGWARMLTLDSVEPGQVKHAAATIERNARAQAQLIDDLLDVSRAVSGHLHLQPEPVDLVPIVESAMEVVQMSATAKGVALELRTGGPSPRVIADPARLRQVVWNLLSNGIKFTPSGGAVRILVERDGDQARIVVSDTGAGIPPEALPFVFDRFWQAENTSGRPSGLGLGLSIVRHIVESHGGTAEARSEGEGRGATFEVRIPVMREAAAT